MESRPGWGGLSYIQYKSPCAARARGGAYWEQDTAVGRRCQSTLQRLLLRRNGTNGISLGYSVQIMKKATELRPEYDFASMKDGVRGKYARRLGAGSNLALLEPDLAAAFPSDAAVNQALRAVLAVVSAVSKSKPRSAR